MDVSITRTFTSGSEWTFLSILALMTSIGYAVLVLLAALFVYLAIYPPHSKRTIINQSVVVIGTAVMEFPLLIVLLKFGILWWVVFTGALVVPLTIMVLWIDLFTLLALFYVFFMGYKAREIVHKHTSEFESHGPKLPGILSLYFWYRIMVPIYVPFNVDCVRDITFATPKEISEANEKEKRYFTLDIYKMKTTTPQDKRPVLLFIHGGSWTGGDKLVPYPQPLYLASNGWIVVSTNYRLSNYPNHIIDCKRALRWIYQNIEKHGGDRNFVCVSGDSSGGHLASIMALTPNDPRYQPGFEDIPTHIHACVPINAVFDLTNHHGIWGIKNVIPDWFAHKICGLDKGFTDPETRRLLEDASPELVLKKRAESGHVVVPFLVFHGANDTLVPASHTREFIKTFRGYQGTNKNTLKVIYVEYPGGHHGYHVISSPKTHYQMIGMLRFLNWVYDNRTDNKNITFE